MVKTHLQFWIKWMLPITCLTVALPVQAQINGYSEESRKIEFPDIPGFQILICDFHQHTVFSDGDVWPNIRVYETLKDGLDAMSITDHQEYQKRGEDVPYQDGNRPYQIACEAAKDHDLLILNGAEISRPMPPGHLNAIFLTDVNKLLLEDPIKVLREAKRQGAFIFWNHPGWISQRPDGKAELTAMHRQLIDEKLISGIEVVNEDNYSDEALQIALDHNLTILGNSDIHGFIDWQYHVPEGGHRPVTLVFAKEKSEAGLKEALENRRTAAWFDNTLVGRPEILVPLIRHSLIITGTDVLRSSKGPSLVAVISIENQSDADYILENRSNFLFHSNASVIIAKAHQTTAVQIKTLKKLSEFDLRFRILNGVTAPGSHPEITLKVNMNWE